MNISENAGVDKSTTVGIMHSLSVGGDSTVNIKGKLDEYIEGDVRSETKKGKTSINTDKGMETNSEGGIAKHSKKEVKVNRTEKSKFF